MKQTTNRTTLQKHQHILYDNLSAMPEKGGFHVVDYSTGGGKTYVCLKWWCEEGHKHYKRMYFVLPQHKNIGSALSDFNSCNEAAHSQLTSLYLKSSNGIVLQYIIHLLPLRVLIIRSPIITEKSCLFQYFMPFEYGSPDKSVVSVGRVCPCT